MDVGTFSGSGTSGVSDIACGMAAHAAVLEALIARGITGEGTKLEVSLFDGMAETLSWLEDQGLPRGVITNKPERFTRPVLAGLGLLDRCASVICPGRSPTTRAPCT